MKPFFKCSCENAVYKGYTMDNSPVNLDNVSQIIKFREAYYPDNEGTPAIKFKTTGGEDIEWVYAKHQEEERDQDYEKILDYRKELFDFIRTNSVI